MLTTTPGTNDPSGKTVQNIIDEARELLAETSSGFWTDPKILEWLSNGVLDMVVKTWATGETENITLATDTLEYTITADFIVTAAVIYDGEKALISGHPTKVGHTPPVGEPTHYYTFDGQMGIYPIAETANNGKICKAYLIPKPAQITSFSTAIPTPAYLDNSLVQYILSMALFKDRKRADAQGVMAGYDKTLMLYRSDLLMQSGRIMDTKTD